MVFPNMIPTRDGYILVLAPDHQEIRNIQAIQADLPYPMVVARSAEQAMTQLGQGQPCLVILVDHNGPSWPQTLVRHLRQTLAATEMTIVALTDSASPQWNHTEDTPELDGFLVKPLSLDIVKSLVESAHARQTWRGI
ncbi:response regulator transcription factor [Phormidium sp. FACHB-1136]|jgi:CheY-like chemotaxis protein|uniref:response regulator transcription factor n=1 Tax=Phormidium sp. FACHB-1136 TaxID=2692848 RepID=UPI0016830619|nr:response regulator transcription factor [Phormidium sp. FACHB-1136]MBD2428779.1 response regulator transcription factor [Phormidium sp. FACHB-1136]